VLSYFLTPPRITISVSIIISLIVFGLTWYYDTLRKYNNEIQKENSLLEDRQQDLQIRSVKLNSWQPPSVLFVTAFAASILISSFTNGQEFHVFRNWNEIGILGTIQLAAAIMLCFFIPGYALVDILSKKYTISGILAVLISYLISILITGLTGYISSLFFDSALSDSKYLFTAVYLAILAFYLIYCLHDRIINPRELQIKNYFRNRFLSGTIIKYLEKSASELLVFACLFTLIIVSTYVLYGGVTIGDQWYHQGRALLFLSGSIREAVLSHGESFYPPFQSALIASLTALSGTPLVNTYASIAFLNAIVIFAFYYFFTAWVPATTRKAALLACVLFTLSAGFGWIYVLNSAANHSVTSAHTSLLIFEKLRGLDLIDPSNYVISPSPEFSTALIYIALPAGFVLWGLVRTCTDTRFNLIIVTAISSIGIISHYEFYLFIIIACLSPIIFRMKAKNSLYCSFLIAISFVYLIDIIVPGNFYTSQEIFGIPLLFLTAFFVTITWIIYFAPGYLWKFFSKRSINFGMNRKLHYSNKRFNFVTRRVIIFLVAYVYLLSFIILGQVPTNTIIDQTSFGTVPWYIYPMKLGVAGLLGLVFILSYLFKRFENEVFIFGIIIIISVIAGPYYNENRFSKYVMIGAVGFASIMIYKIFNRRLSNNSLRNLVIIGIIIPTSSLSILLYIGYSSFILETHDYTPPPSRRHFPANSELHLLEELHGMVNNDSNRYNVISFSNQYDRWKDGFMVKIPSFSGLPYDKLRQSPLALNASTLDALYHHLAYSDTRYILIPKVSLQGGNVITEPTRFVLEYFKRVYEDDNYIILEVPPLASPYFSSKSEVALVYNQSIDMMPREVSDVRLLQFDNKTFDLKENETAVTILGNNTTQKLDLRGAKMNEPITIWSKNISADKKPNYIETRFKIVSTGANKSNDVRLDWQESENGYYVKLSKDGLELYQSSIGNQSKKILLKNADTDKKDQTWYNLEVASRDDSINIYLNDVLKIKASRTADNKTETISKVGLTTYYNNVEFKPLKIGTVTDNSQKVSEGSEYYNYYYPLSLLALSKSSYDIFSDSDSSVFSKHVIVVPDSLNYNNDTLQRYLEYVRQGGTLILVNSQNNFTSKVNELFLLKSNGGNETAFTDILGDKNQKVLINISGFVKPIYVMPSPGIDVIASYRNNKNESVAPFIIEKSFTNGGKLILVNSRGYFDSVSKTPTKYFLTLSNMSRLLPVDLGKGPISYNTSKPLSGFVGKMETYGKISLNSSSLTIPHAENTPYPLHVSGIKIFNRTNSAIVVKNLSIKDLKLVGDNIVNVNVSGRLEIPYARSVRDYIGSNIPSGFNMTVLSPRGPSNIEITTQNQSLQKSIIINNYSRVEFYSIKPESEAKSVPLLFKNPEMKADGHIMISNTDFDGFINERGRVTTGIALDLKGHLDTKFAFVDKFDLPYRNSTRTTYMTYLKALSMNGTFTEDKDRLNLPGDIFYKAKGTEQDINLKKVLTAPSNIVILIILIPIVIIIGEIIWRKKKL